MNKIKISESDRKAIAMNLKKVLGQVNSIMEKVQDDNITDDILTQLLAVKGGASRCCKDIIAKGIMPNIHKYSQKELDGALNMIFRIDG
jgi:DNA-binding FrmR family transcriptional regulator